MIAKGQVMIALQPWIGPRLSGWLDPLLDRITHKLNLFVPRRDDASGLSMELEEMLYQAVMQLTRCTLLAELPDGTWVKMQREDFSMMADDLMGLIFEQFPVDGQHLLLLRQHSLQCASLSALRVLYTRFASLHTEEELASIAHVTRACHAPSRWRGWLSQSYENR